MTREGTGMELHMNAIVEQEMVYLATEGGSKHPADDTDVWVQSIQLMKGLISELHMNAIVEQEMVYLATEGGSKHPADDTHVWVLLHHFLALRC